MDSNNPAIKTLFDDIDKQMRRAGKTTPRLSRLLARAESKVSQCGARVCRAAKRYGGKWIKRGMVLLAAIGITQSDTPAQEMLGLLPVVGEFQMGYDLGLALKDLDAAMRELEALYPKNDDNFGLPFGTDPWWKHKY